MMETATEQTRSNSATDTATNTVTDTDMETATKTRTVMDTNSDTYIAMDKVVYTVTDNDTSKWTPTRPRTCSRTLQHTLTWPRQRKRTWTKISGVGTWEGLMPLEYAQLPLEKCQNRAGIGFYQSAAKLQIYIHMVTFQYSTYFME